MLWSSGEKREVVKVLINFIFLIVLLNLGPLWFMKRCDDKKEFDSVHPQGLKG